jgi:two-component system response regulator FixJ
MEKNTSSQIRLLIVEDDELLRNAVKLILQRKGGFLVTEAADGAGAVEAFKREAPDVVLLDLRLPDMNGIETMVRLNDFGRHVPVIIMTGYGDVPSAVEAMKHGAYDFTEKPLDYDKLIPLLNRAAAERGAKSELDAAYKGLTPREREILRMTVKGLTCTNIAEMLTISPRTVETHRANLMQKLKIRNKSELIRFAFIHGILPESRR